VRDGRGDDVDREFRVGRRTQKVDRPAWMALVYELQLARWAWPLLTGLDC